MWNGYRDYLKNKKQLIDLKKKFSNLILLSTSNFSFEKNISFPLDNLNLNSENNLVEINGINYMKKFKYKFPSIFHFTIFLDICPDLQNILKKKLFS